MGGWRGWKRGNEISDVAVGGITGCSQFLAGAKGINKAKKADILLISSTRQSSGRLLAWQLHARAQTRLGGAGRMVG